MIALERRKKLNVIKKVNSRISDKLSNMYSVDFKSTINDKIPMSFNGFVFNLKDDEFSPLMFGDNYVGDLKKISNGHKTSIACYYRWLGTEPCILENHYHPHVEKFVTTKGKFEIEIGGRNFVIGEGDSFEIDAFTPHVVKVYPNTACSITWFKK